MKTYINEINGIQYSIKIEEALYSQAQSLYLSINKIPPEKIRNGFKIEIGFSVFILVENDDGYSVTVPDYTKNPLTDTTDDLTLAFLIQLEQIGILRSYNIEGKTVRFDDIITVEKNALQEKQVYMQRSADLGGSGWCINAVVIDENEDTLGDNKEYEMYYAYQLLNIRPELIKPLFLPDNYIAVFDDTAIVEIFNGKDVGIF